MLARESDELRGHATVVGEPSDDRTVDLELGDGQRAHPGLRLLDGAHVVDRDPDPQGAYLGQRLGGLDRHGVGLGEFQREQRRGHSRRAEMVRQPLGEARLGELRGGDVHGDLDSAAATHERSTVTAGRLEHHIADGDHGPGRLGEGDEVARWEDPALGVAPAAQGLEGDEESVAQVDLRLVLGDDLAPLDGPAQIACEPLVV